MAEEKVDVKEQAEEAAPFRYQRGRAAEPNCWPTK